MQPNATFSFESYIKKGKFVISIEEDNGRTEVMNSYKIKHQNLDGIRPFHRKHEIFVHNGWDIFKLLNFLSYMPDSFICHKIKRSKKDGIFDKVIEIYEGETIIFEIYVSNGLEKQQVFLKNFTQWIKVNKKLSYYFIEKTQWDVEKPERHPLIHFGKYFGRADNALCPILNAAYTHTA